MFTVVSAIIFKFLLFEMNYIRADVVEETLIVRHYQKRLLPILQVTDNVTSQKYKSHTQHMTHNNSSVRCRLHSVII